MSLLAATVLTAVATTVLAVGAIITAIFAFLAFRKQTEEVRTIQEQAKDQRELTRQQAELLKIQSGQLELQRQQSEEQRPINEKQAEVLALQASEIQASLEQRKRDADEQRRKQAARVTAWFAREETNAGPFWRAQVRNASDEPVFEIRVFFHFMHEADGAGRQPVGHGGPPSREMVPIVPPGEDRSVAVPNNVRAMFGKRIIDDRTCAVSIEFTDAAGNRWERDPRGALVART